MKLKTYIINLEKSTVRRDYMTDLLSPYGFMDVTFIKAVDGRLMTQEERNQRFDYKGCMKRYGREMNAGEVGCLMSHRKAYDTILREHHSYALILEDDVAPVRSLDELDMDAVESLMNTDIPQVLMLSGDYWYYRRKPIGRLFAAVGAYGYIINAAAAEMILSIDKPCNVADDWAYYKRRGLKMYAVCPYMLDANVNMEVLPSDVKQDSWGINRKKMSVFEVITGYLTGAVKKYMKATGHFEYKTNIYQNKIAPKKTNPFK